MIQALKKGFMLATLIVLSSCDKGGSSNNKQVQITSPQGRVQGQDAANFCDLSGTSITCYSKNSSGQVCNSTAKSYSDTTTLCQSLVQIKNEMYNTVNVCDVSSSVNVVNNQYNCSITGGQQNASLNPINPSFPSMTDPNMKTIKCDFEAYRNNQNGGWSIMNQVYQTPKTTAIMTFDGRYGQNFNLRNYFIFDIGNFGTLNMNFVPAGNKGTADTMTISSKGFRNQNGDKMNMSQSGFAGQAIELETISSDGKIKLNVSCAGQQPSQFKKNVTKKSFSKFVCRGTSSLYGSRRENIEIALPYDSSLLSNEVSLAENLKAQVTEDVLGQDNARITFTADGVCSDMKLVSSAYLKTMTKLNATDGYTTLDLTCGPQ
jgi:hypothetical protein